MRSVLPSPSIIGLGLVTSFGWDAKTYYRGLLRQRSAVKQVELDGLEEGCLVGRVPDGGQLEDSPSRFGRALFAAAREAVADAYSVGWTPGKKVGLVLSTTLGEVEMRRQLYFALGGHTRPARYLTVMPSTSPSMMMHELGFSGGPVMNIQAACAGFVTALMTAKMFLDNELADDVLVIGCDFPNTGEDAWHFREMRALIASGDPLDVCRPFQVGGEGFVTGEGAGAVVLSRREVRRDYGQLLGGAINHDPYHPIGINPNHRVVLDVYAAALADSGVEGGDVDYFNTHGAGTVQGDAAEIHVLRRHLPSARLFSIKPLTGHAHGAAGIVELSASLLAYRHGKLAVAPRVAELNPLLIEAGRPNALLNGVMPYQRGLTVKGSMGMGGYNAAVVIWQP